MNAYDNLVYVYNTIRPVIDIAVLAFVLYKCYQIIVKTQGLQIFRAIIIIGFIYLFAIILNLETLLWILSILAPGVLVCFAIIFQPELRKIILRIGQRDWFKSGNRAKHTYIDSVLLAADMLSKQHRGMLAVFTRNTSLKEFAESGTPLNADLTSSLLVTIFGHDTPMHDGAVIIQGGKLIAAGCFLPLSEQYDIKKTFGTRHRAALGLSEETDAIILVVSEESGSISLAYDSKLHYDLTREQLVSILENQLDVDTETALAEVIDNED